MRSVTYSMAVSLDGYVVGPDGSFNWMAPDEEVFNLATDEVRKVGVHLLGRRLYETMLYWETADQNPSLDYSTLEFAAIWRALPKVVFSTTLSAVQGNARVASHRRVSDQGLAGAGGRWPSLLSPTRGPGEPQTHRVPYPQFESGLPPLPRGPLADSSRRAQEGTRQPRQ